jgi:hypothetical protein
MYVDIFTTHEMNEMLWHSYSMFSFIVAAFQISSLLVTHRGIQDLTDDSVTKLEEILMDSAKAKAILESAKISMG